MAFTEVNFSGCPSWDFIFSELVFFLFLSYTKIILNLLFSVRIIIDLIIYGFIKANDLLIFLCMFNFDDKQAKQS